MIFFWHIWSVLSTIKRGKRNSKRVGVKISDIYIFFEGDISNGLGSSKTFYFTFSSRKKKGDHTLVIVFFYQM